MDDRSLEPVAHATSPDTYLCDRCGAPMAERQCKIVCLNCGMMRDCSDP